MSELKNITPDQFGDIFGTSNQPNINTIPSFGTGLENNADIFSTNPVNPVIPEKEEPPVKEPDQVVEVPDPEKEADLFTDEQKNNPSNTQEINSLTEYYKDRLTKGQFVEIQAEDENGKKTAFIPQTPEEFDEVIQIQVDYKLDKAKEELEKSWYESKSPAWKVVSQYAEMVDDPTQLIPFLQGVKTIQSVSNLDESDLEQAEQIVRSRMEQRGDPEGLIKSQIDSLKSTDNLIKTAQQIKPLMIQEEQKNLAAQIQKAKEEEREYLRVVNDIRENAHKAIEEPLFGKQKLKQDEKAAIYDLIAIPQEETGGYGIYSVIDKLFDNKDFDTLKMIALLASKKDAFFQYLGTNIANQTADSLRKKLTVAGEMRNSGKDFVPGDQQPVVKRNQYSKTPRFGK